jgi:hypothetical protein
MQPAISSDLGGAGLSGSPAIAEIFLEIRFCNSLVISPRSAGAIFIDGSPLTGAAPLQAASDNVGGEFCVPVNTEKS